MKATPPTWDESYAAFAAFVKTRRRLPALESGDPDEQRLWAWMLTQRDDIHLDPKRLAALDEVHPGWLGRAEGPWRAGVEAVARYRKATGRWPVSGPVGEWLERARAAVAAGLVPKHRRDYASRHLGRGWARG